MKALPRKLSNSDGWNALEDKRDFFQDLATNRWRLIHFVINKKTANNLFFCRVQMSFTTLDICFDWETIETWCVRNGSCWDKIILLYAPHEVFCINNLTCRSYLPFFFQAMFNRDTLQIKLLSWSEQNI